MSSVATRIMRRVRGHGRGKWVCTPGDFLDLGSRAAVDGALSRLVRSGRLRRVGRGLYDLPEYSRILKGPVPPDLETALRAIERRDKTRFMRSGMTAANMLNLTTAVPMEPVYVTNGRTRIIRVGGWTVRLRHERAAIMAWHGRPGAIVIQALHLLGPREADDPRAIVHLRRLLPDYVKADLEKGLPLLPCWVRRIVTKIVDSDYQEPKPKRDRRTSNSKPRDEARDLIAATLEGAGKCWVRLSLVGQRLRAARPDFDPYHYGFMTLSVTLGELVEGCDGFETVRRKSGVIRIRRKAAAV